LIVSTAKGRRSPADADRDELLDWCAEQPAALIAMSIDALRTIISVKRYHEGPR